jgi:hypothetical protein
MKNNIEFYRHKTSSHNHWKFKALRLEYDWAGEGKFWALNNIIADADFCKLDINNEKRKKALAADLCFTMDELDKFLKFLEIDCELIVNDRGFLITPMTQEVLADVMITRERKRNWKNKKEQEVAGQSSEKDIETAKVDVYFSEKDGEKTHTTAQHTTVNDIKVDNILSSGEPEGPAHQQEINLTKEYKSLVKTKDSIYRFINIHKPDFFEPYVDLWNIFAIERKLPKCEIMSDTRKKKFKVRIKEKPFQFIAVLTRAGRSSFLLGSNWFTFDWIIANDTNYLKVIEGKYDNEKKVETSANEPSSFAQQYQTALKTQP